MQSKATTVAAYLAELPSDRRAAIEAVRAVIRKNLDADFHEGMQYGMICYSVPHRVYPAGYHCDPRQPLPYAGLASQKNYMSVYLMPLYSAADPAGGARAGDHARWFADAWARSGKKLDMGKSCIRFKRVEDLALEVIGEAVRRFTVKDFVKLYEAGVTGMNRRPVKGATKARPATPGVRRRPAAGASARGKRQPRARAD